MNPDVTPAAEAVPQATIPDANAQSTSPPPKKRGWCFRCVRWLFSSGVLFFVSIALVLSWFFVPWPHWQEISSESCVTCGNRRWVITRYRWWSESEQSQMVTEEYPLDEAHDHRWWQYAVSTSSFRNSTREQEPSVYQDGRSDWQP